MNLKLPLINFKDRGLSSGGSKSSVSEVASSKFIPVEFVVEDSRLSQRMKGLLNGDGLEQYKDDESSAVIAVCISMVKLGYSEQQIASLLTDKKYYLGQVAYRHRKTESRSKAARWIQKYNIVKAKKFIHSTILFDDELPNTSGDKTISQRKPQQLTLENFENIQFELSSRALVEDLIDHNSFVLLVGETNSGKTFAALDIAFSVARGEFWFGRKVDQGAVLYVAAEGGRGIKKRIVAYRSEYNLENTPIPFRLASGTIDLRDPTMDVQKLIKEIKNTESIFDESVRLVVIDTLSRALSGGDENSSDEMGAFVKSVDLIRQKTDATVMVVHHTGKDTSRGARGHSLLKGAVDTELTLEKKEKKDPYIKITKQRDYEIGNPIGFQLKSVELGKTDKGKSITSCVIQSSIFDTIVSDNKPKLGDVPLKAFEVLKSINKNLSKGTPVSIWRKKFLEIHYKGRSRQTQSSAFKAAINKLSDYGYIEIRGQNVRVLLEK